MNIFAVVVSALMVVISIAFGKNKESDVLSVTSEPTPTQTAMIESTPSPKATPKYSPTSTSGSISDNSSFVYPNSITISSGPGHLTLESTDDSGIITDWYEAKIKSMDYNAKSFVKTKANDKVINELTASKSGSELKITIKKDPGEQNTKIEVTY